LEGGGGRVRVREGLAFDVELWVHITLVDSMCKHLFGICPQPLASHKLLLGACPFCVLLINLPALALPITLHADRRELRVKMSWDGKETGLCPLMPASSP
jgi:hypothetical protein